MGLSDFVTIGDVTWKPNQVFEKSGSRGRHLQKMLPFRFFGRDLYSARRVSAGSNRAIQRWLITATRITAEKTRINCRLGSMGRLLLPPYLVEDRSQALSFFWIDTFDESYPALQMFTEVRMRFKVLSLWRLAYAIGKYRLQHIEVNPPHIESLIGHQAGQMLTR